MKTVGGLRKLRHRGIGWIGSSPSPPPPITWSGCGIWRRGVPDRRPRVSLAPSSGQRVPDRCRGGGRDTHDGHENSPILVFFSNLLYGADTGKLMICVYEG